MHLSTFLNGFLAISTLLLSTSAIPQPDPDPDLIARQQNQGTDSRFTSTVTTQCYTARQTTQLARRPTTTTSTSYTSGQSTTTIRTTAPFTPRARTATTTSTSSVTSTVTNYNGTVATTTTTSTSLQTTTSTVTRTTGTTTTSTLSTSTVTTVPAPPGFSPVSSTLPRPKRALLERDNPPIAKRQRGGRPRGGIGRGRPRNYPGDVSCLALVATGTVATRTRTIYSTLPPSTTTSTRTVTTTIRSTVFPPNQQPATTIVQSTTTTSLIVFTRTAVSTTTDTMSLTSTSTSSTYAACTDLANRVSRLSAYDNRPIIGVTYDYATYSGNGTSVYDCCVSAIMDGYGVMWAYDSAAAMDSKCLVLTVDKTAGMMMCAGGQAGQGTTTEVVVAGQVGGAQEFTVGNAYCGDWNAVDTSSG